MIFDQFQTNFRYRAVMSVAIARDSDIGNEFDSGMIGPGLKKQAVLCPRTGRGYPFNPFQFNGIFPFYNPAVGPVLPRELACFPKDFPGPER